MEIKITQVDGNTWKAETPRGIFHFRERQCCGEGWFLIVWSDKVGAERYIPGTWDDKQEAAKYIYENFSDFLF